MAPIATLTVRLSAQIAEFQQQFQQASRSTQQFQNNFQSVATKAAALGSFFGITAAAGVAKLTSELAGFVSQSSRLSAVQGSFEKLAGSVGQSADSMRDAMRASTAGLVSDLDLMQSANKAILLGLPVTTQEMGDLAKTATVLGKAMGQDATKSLDDLITALGRSSPLILDNLGLTVKVGEANEKYATQLGKSVEAMTEAERKTAFYLAAMDAARGKVNELGEQTRTLAEIAQSAWTSIGNVVTRTAATVNTQVGAILSNRDRLKGFFELLLQTRSIGASIALAQGVEESKDAKRPDTNLVSTMEQQIAGLRREAQAATASLVPLTATQRELAAEFLRGGKSVESIVEKLNSVKATAGVSQAQIKALADQMTVSKKSTDAYRESVKDLADQLSGAKLRGDVQRLNDAWRSLTPQQRASEQVMQRTAESAQALADSGARLTDELFLLTLRTGEFGRNLRPTNDSIDLTKAGFADLTPAIRASADELIKWNEVMNSITVTRGVSGLQLPGERFGKPEIPELPPDVSREWLNLARSIDELQSVIPGAAGELLSLGAAGVAAFAQMSKAAQNFQALSVQSLAAGISSFATMVSLVQQAAAFLERNNLSGRQVRDFEAQFGGRQGLEAQAALAGVSTLGIDTAMARNSASMFERESARIAAAIRDQQDALERYGLSWRDFNSTIAQTQVDQIVRDLAKEFENLTRAGVNPAAVIKGMSGAFNQLIIDAKKTGTQIPRALQPMLETLIRSRELSEDAARALLGMADDGMPALADIREAAERYGLTLDQLGPKVKQLEIKEQAAEIVADFKLLEAAGADVGTVALAMKDRIQDIVTASITTGVEVPEAMRPILEILLQMGALTDENGTKLEDLDRVNFGKNLTDSIEDLIGALRDLIDQFNDAGSAAENAWARFRGDNPVTGKAVPRPPEGIPTPSPAPPTTPTTPGGRPSFSSNTTSQSVSPFSNTVGGGEGGSTHEINVVMDGDTLTRTVIRNLGPVANILVG